MNAPVTPHFILYAPNVHTGGGFVLLEALLASWPKSRQLTAFLDMRAQGRLTVPQGARVFWVTASAGSRLQAEFGLRREASAHSTVLCFHGLPPLLPNSAHVVVFQQNRIHLGLIPLRQFRWKTRLRLLVERFVSRNFRQRVSEYIVQTPSMRRASLEWYMAGNPAREPVVKILPFISTMHNPPQSDGLQPAWDFVYVADGEAHKNHRVLLAAWQLLAQDGLHPSLALTLGPRDTGLQQEVAAAALKAGLRITNLGHMPHESILALYSSAKALIFPSTSESFGLPLIEAAHCGLPILAAELDYVRDVCSPVHTFDPASPVSIARAVKRFLSVPEPDLTLRSPEEFWQELLKDRRT